MSEVLTGHSLLVAEGEQLRAALLTCTQTPEVLVSELQSSEKPRAITGEVDQPVELQSCSPGSQSCFLTLSSSADCTTTIAVSVPFLKAMHRSVYWSLSLLELGNLLSTHNASLPNSGMSDGASILASAVHPCTATVSNQPLLTLQSGGAQALPSSTNVSCIGVSYSRTESHSEVRVAVGPFEYIASCSVSLGYGREYLPRQLIIGSQYTPRRISPGAGASLSGG